MKFVRRIAICLLALVCLCALFAPQLAPHRYDEQFRDAPAASPGGRFPMGTDEIGRDRLSRLLEATRVSILLAPGAAAVSILLGLLFASAGGMSSRFGAAAISTFTTISLSLPWIFLFLIFRSELPLNTSPAQSILLTFGLMGLAGWAWPARVFAAAIARMRQSGWLLQARASGMPGWRIALVHGWPELRSVAMAQFRVLIPVYILSEASLGLLGLGVAEPLPSWGNLLRDLQRPAAVRDNPWVLAPLILLIVVMICLEALQTVTQTGTQE